MAIKYEAYTRQGEKVQGVLETDSEEDAYGQLAREQLVPYRLRPVRPRPSLVRLAPGLFPPPTPQDVIDFTKQMQSLLSSGIPLRRALIVQRDQTRSLGLKEALAQIIMEIEAGTRVSDAFARHTTVFPEFYLRLLRVGEATGSLPFTLEQLADNLKRRKTVADRVKRALIYPAISLAVAFIAAVVLVTYSLPSLTSLLREFGGQLPRATQLLITISDALQAYGILFVGPLVGFAVLATVAFRTTPGKRLRDGVLLAIPVVSGILTGSNMFYLTTTLSTLLKAGVPPIEALKLAEEGLSNVVFRERLRQVTEKASGGMRLGRAFEEQGGFTSILGQAIVTGEMQGNIADTLGGLAEYYEDVTERAVSGATELIQPAVILIVAAVVGFVAVAVISGIYSTLGSVK